MRATPKPTKPLPPVTPQQLARFWKHVVKSDGCWEWAGAKRNQYGVQKIIVDGQKFLIPVHRLSYWLHEKDPASLCVCHRCDNPICVRPDHLFLGTMSQNSRDMFGKGRNRHPSDEHKPPKKKMQREKLTEQAVREMRASVSNPPQYGAYAAIARKYRISEQTAREVILRHSWQHVA